MATGVYHKANVLKLRIMRAVFQSNHPVTCREIADIIDVPLVNVSFAMNHYQQLDHRYFKRLKPISGKAYRYALTKTGAKYYALYCLRLYEGFDLSLSATKVKSMPKREKIIQERKAEFARRQAEFERTGIVPPQRPKPTLKEILNFDPADLSDYMGITKQGAIEMGITEVDIVFFPS